MLVRKMKKAYLNKEEFDKLLGRKPLTQFVEDIKNAGYHITYQNFYSLYKYNDKSNWSLTLAFGVAEVLNVPIEQLFYIKYV